MRLVIAVFDYDDCHCGRIHVKVNLHVNFMKVISVICIFTFIFILKTKTVCMHKARLDKYNGDRRLLMC